MGFFWTIVIILGGTWLIWGFYKEFGPEPVEKRIKRYEEDADMFFSSLQVDYKVVYGLDELDERVLAMKGWYIRLREKYKHKEEKTLQTSEDWAHYLENQNSLASNIFQRGEADDDREAQKLFDEDIRENQFKIEEIENRFAYLLGEGYEKKLENIRAKENK